MVDKIEKEKLVKDFVSDNNFDTTLIMSNEYGDNNVPYNQRWGTPVDGSLANENEWSLAWTRKINFKANAFSIISMILFLAALVLTISSTAYYTHNPNMSTITKNLLGIFIYTSWALFGMCALLSIVFQIILLIKIWNLKPVIKGYEAIRLLLIFGIVFQITCVIATHRLNKQIFSMREKYGITEEFNHIC